MDNIKSLNKPSARIGNALQRIRILAQEIADTAADPSRKLSDLFSEGAIQAKANACIELALSVADCNRPKWLREVRSEIEKTQDAVIAADNALAPRMTMNPEMMNHFLGAEQKVFDMMLSPSPKVLALAKLARMIRSQLMTYLHKECVSIRIELLHWESENGVSGTRDSGSGIRGAGAHAARTRELVKYTGMRQKGKSEQSDILDINEKFEDEQSEKYMLYVRDMIHDQRSAPRADLVDFSVPGDCFVKYYRKHGFEKAGLSLQDFGTYAISLFNSYFYYPIDRTETFLDDMIEEYRDKTEDENGNVTDRELLPHLIYENAKFARRTIKYMAYFRGECEWPEGSLSFADLFTSDLDHFIEEFSLVCEVFGSYAMREKYMRQLRRTTASIDIVLEEIRTIFPSEELERFKKKLWFFTYAFLYPDTNEKGMFDLTKERINALRDAADALVRNIEANERDFKLKRNQARFAQSQFAATTLLPPLQKIAESSERSATANEKTLCTIGELKGKLVTAVAKDAESNPTKIAKPDLADSTDCKRFISELAETLERDYRKKIHNHGQAVDYILTGAKSGDLFYEDCRIARQIKSDRNWEYSTFFNYSKPIRLPKPKNLRKAARKRATQKKTRKELKMLTRRR